MSASQPLRLTPKAALLKASSWCAYQERSQHELRSKVAEWGIYGEDAEELIVKLIQEGFVNEERFAKAYAGGKFRMKHWGRHKIIHGLKQHRVSQRNIETALKEIEVDTYFSTLEQLAVKKWKSLSGHRLLKMQKATRYLLDKGYESHLIQEVIKQLE